MNAAGTLVDLSFGQSAASCRTAPWPAPSWPTYRQATAEAVTRTEALMRELVGDQAPVLDIIRASAPELQEES